MKKKNGGRKNHGSRGDGNHARAAAVFAQGSQLKIDILPVEETTSAQGTKTTAQANAPAASSQQPQHLSKNVTALRFMKKSQTTSAAATSSNAKAFAPAPSSTPSSVAPTSSSTHTQQAESTKQAAGGVAASKESDETAPAGDLSLPDSDEIAQEWELPQRQRNDGDDNGETSTRKSDAPLAGLSVDQREPPTLTTAAILGVVPYGRRSYQGCNARLEALLAERKNRKRAAQGDREMEDQMKLLQKFKKQRK
ncbi:unnamed protein product [Amoebophrya sp. A25]|nr:unnamed protein product [Amoebophrya sp. A25]|eukprot:GSA25T00010115001.1